MADKPRKRRWPRRLLVAAAVVAAMLIAARWPVTTRVGYNYVVTVKRLTLLEKIVAFASRDFEMRRLTREIAGTEGTPEQRLLRMYDWVVNNIHPVPPDMPVVDDHVLYIFVRHYGAADQRAEALAVLASYDGMPASTMSFGKNPRRRFIQVTVVNLDNRLVLFDVNNRVIFRTSSGALATLNDLRTDPSIIEKAGAGVVVDGAPYPEHFRRIAEATPSFVRMEKQRMWPRLWNEFVERVFGS